MGGAAGVLLAQEEEAEGRGAEAEKAYLKALELKLFEDQRDTIKLKNLVSSVVDDETQQKIDVVKQRLIKYFGYNEASATDVLNYVASIFARGDVKE